MKSKEASQEYHTKVDIKDTQLLENQSYVHILYFEKYEFEILNALFFSCGTIQSRQIYYINSVVI